MRLKAAAVPGYATEMLCAALNYCHEKMGNANVATLLKTNDPMALGYFRYALAQEIGRYLGAIDDLIREVLLCPEDMMDDQPPATRPLTLIIAVERRTAALEAVVDGLEGDLAGGYRELLQPSANGLKNLTNFCLVDDDDRRQQRGMAALIHSWHTPALPVWRR